uniref:DNA polymerase eta n=1 Tax=Romanomermis culicivorax TaxID=13658 RepID=A0A915HSU0_ROMCU
MNAGVNNRVIALIDMDCFYVQVEQRENPRLWNRPVAVVQYNAFRTGKGGIIAVSYEARSSGVKRGMMTDEAKTICPELELVTAPGQRQKPDLTKYRQASEEFFKILCSFENVVVEKASIDEAYLDLTKAVESELEFLEPDSMMKILNDETSHFPTSYSADSTQNLKALLENCQLNDENLKLLWGAKLIEYMRKRILEETQFHSSAGISYNKTLAKLVCSFNKPKKQTILLPSMLDSVFKTTPLQKVRFLGGKLGDRLVNEFNLTTMSDLRDFSFSKLKDELDESTACVNFSRYYDPCRIWLNNLSRGIDDELVSARQIPKSIACGKNFPGINSLRSKSQVSHWLRLLAEELEERLTADQSANKRSPRTLTVSLTLDGGSGRQSLSRQTPLSFYDANGLVKISNRLLNEFNTADKSSEEWKPSILHLSLTASSKQITSFFKKNFDDSSLSTTLIDVDKNSDSNDIEDIFLVGKKDKNHGIVDLEPSTSVENKATLDDESRSSSNSHSFFRTLLQNRTRNMVQKPTAIEEKPQLDFAQEFLSSKVDSPNSKFKDQYLNDKPSTSRFTKIFDNRNTAKSDARSSTSSLLFEKDMHGVTACPENRDDIDPEVWRNLTPELRFEINNFYRRKKNEQQKSGDAGSQYSDTNKSKTVASKNTNKKLTRTSHKVTTTKKSPAEKKKKMNSEKNNVTLFSYYDKL